MLQQAYEALEQRRASAAVLSSPSFTSKSGTAYDASDDTIRLPLEPRKPDIKKHAGSFSYSRPVSCLRSWTEACPARYSCAASGWGSLLELNDRNSKQLLRQDIQVTGRVILCMPLLEADLCPAPAAVLACHAGAA